MAGGQLGPARHLSLGDGCKRCQHRNAAHDGHFRPRSSDYYMGIDGLQYCRNHHGHDDAFLEHVTRPQAIIYRFDGYLCAWFNSRRYIANIQPDAVLPAYPGCGRRHTDSGIAGDNARKISPLRNKAWQWPCTAWE